MRRVSGKVPEGRRMGPATVLTDIEEQKLETWLLTIAKNVIRFIGAFYLLL